MDLARESVLDREGERARVNRKSAGIRATDVGKNALTASPAAVYSKIENIKTRNYSSRCI